MAQAGVRVPGAPTQPPRAGGLSSCPGSSRAHRTPAARCSDRAAARPRGSVSRSWQWMTAGRSPRRTRQARHQKPDRNRGCVMPRPCVDRRFKPTNLTPFWVRSVSLSMSRSQPITVSARPCWANPSASMQTRGSSKPRFVTSMQTLATARSSRCRGVACRARPMTGQSPLLQHQHRDVRALE